MLLPEDEHVLVDEDTAQVTGVDGTGDGLHLGHGGLQSEVDVEFKPRFASPLTLVKHRWPQS
ncbi:hypothetical protein GCM10011578_054240 [Streptomyces fuscichromogenes]|uniref:Uncharacterized protein n=1 Tax=Streptomyces fuscichromogenes TaxID=1324013 RepID=A0A917XHE1_9ACTN|nr:hypothetical protein GCM10011578_054240 [Streptomyces fuscichromogenes]